MPKKILQKESPVLRKISQEVKLEEVKLPKIQTIIRELKNALNSQDDGVAIAAPQIGYPLRMFVVSKKVDDIVKKEKSKSLTQKEQGENDEMHKTPPRKDLVFINPVIKKISKEKKVLEEGCLSVRYLYGKVTRSNKATVTAYDENGKKFNKGASGLLAQIFQHEVDHLNGILFIDKAKYVEEIIPIHLKKKVKNEIK